MKWKSSHKLWYDFHNVYLCKYEDFSLYCFGQWWVFHSAVTCATPEAMFKFNTKKKIWSPWFSKAYEYLVNLKCVKDIIDKG